MDTAKPASVIHQAISSQRLPDRQYAVTVRVTILSLTSLPGDIVTELGELIPSDGLPEQERLRFAAKGGDRGVEATRVFYSLSVTNVRRGVRLLNEAVSSFLSYHGYQVISEKRLVRQAPPWLCIQRPARLIQRCGGTSYTFILYSYALTGRT